MKTDFMDFGSFREAEITPDGFDYAAVFVFQSLRKARVNFSCFGPTDSQEKIANFIAALHEAETIRDRWNADGWMPKKAPAPGGE